MTSCCMRLHQHAISRRLSHSWIDMECPRHVSTMGEIAFYIFYIVKIMDVLQSMSIKLLIGADYFVNNQDGLLRVTIQQIVRCSKVSGTRLIRVEWQSLGFCRTMSKDWGAEDEGVMHDRSPEDWRAVLIEILDLSSIIRFCVLALVVLLMIADLKVVFHDIKNSWACREIKE